MATPNLITATSLVETLLCSNQLTATTDTAVYTVPANTGVKIATASICNRHTSAVTVDVHVVPSGQAVADSRKIIAGYSLAAGDTLSLTDIVAGMMLGQGDYISVKASVANVVNVILTGAVAT